MASCSVPRPRPFHSFVGQGCWSGCSVPCHGCAPGASLSSISGPTVSGWSALHGWSTGLDTPWDGMDRFGFYLGTSVLPAPRPLGVLPPRSSHIGPSGGVAGSGTVSPTFPPLFPSGLPPPVVQPVHLPNPPPMRFLDGLCFEDPIRPGNPADTPPPPPLACTVPGTLVHAPPPLRTTRSLPPVPGRIHRVRGRPGHLPQRSGRGAGVALPLPPASPPQARVQEAPGEG